VYCIDIISIVYPGGINLSDESPFDWQPLSLPPAVLASLREKSILCVGLIYFDRQWGPLAWIAEIRPNSRACELLKEPTRRSEIYEGLAYTGIEFQGIGDEQIVVARRERREESSTRGLEIYTDLLLFAVDETQLSAEEGENLYGLLTLVKVVMDRSEGKVEKIPETLFSALSPLSTTIKDVIEGFQVVRAPRVDLQTLNMELIGLLFVHLKQKKFIRRFWPPIIENQDSSDMELFLFRMLTRQSEPPWNFGILPQSLPWGFHICSEFNGQYLTTLYSKSFGMTMAALSKTPLSKNLLHCFNVLLSLLEELGLDHDGDSFTEVIKYVMKLQYSKLKPNKERRVLELILRSKFLIPFFQNDQIRSEVQTFSNRMALEKYPLLTTLIAELGSDSIYDLAKKIDTTLNETLAMVMYLQSRDLINLQRIRT